ncbi:MAG: hypothetical protein PHH73_00035 [Candidatus Rickettsiella isopodorum]|nr:hypothetical protein [Candidatus Rickettsiella isopodorum]
MRETQQEINFTEQRKGKKLTGQLLQVYDIVKRLSPARTEILKIEGMKQGISCADRFLRWLSEQGLVRSYKLEKDRTKTWEIIGNRSI